MYLTHSEVIKSLQNSYLLKLPFTCFIILFCLGKCDSSIVVCITPLTSIMLDQHSKFSLKGLKTDFVGEAQSDPMAEHRVCTGASQLVFISPESLLTRYRTMLLRQVYKDNLVAVVVDEAHCVRTWGNEFRVAFSEIGNLRSIIPPHINILALTATLTSETLVSITERLALKSPTILATSPQRNNIYYSIVPPITVDDLAKNLRDEFSEKRAKFPKTVLFCRRYTDCSALYITLRKKLGSGLTEPPDYPDLSEFRMVELYTKVSKPAKREAVVERFCKAESTLRLVIATMSFGMGIDCSDLRRVIHWGLPSTIEDYVQETGRAGRDEKMASAVLHEGKQGHYATQEMKAYVSNKVVCRRMLMYQDFLGFESSALNTGHCKCCDVCANVCKCVTCMSNS